MCVCVRDQCIEPALMAKESPHAKNRIVRTKWLWMEYQELLLYLITQIIYFRYIANENANIYALNNVYKFTYSSHILIAPD